MRQIPHALLVPTTCLSKVFQFVGIASPTVSLEACFYYSFLPEKLSYTCTCSFGQSERTYKLLSEDILIIHMSRFDQGFTLSKKQNKVVFPFKWIIRARYLEENKDKLYELVGVIEHMGPLNYGHYVSYVKQGSNWYFCDNESIVPVSEKRVFSFNFK